LFENGFLFDNSEPWVAPSLIKPMTITEKDEIAKLPVLDIDIEQAQYLQTISEGWAYPLARFMNEAELLEVL
jgi:ATP sulfurylase